ncbi:MAG: hypothetical protein ACRDUX_29525, partial [Mycobacterium sp.]
MKRPTAKSHLGEDSWPGEVVAGQRRALEVADQQDAEVGAVVDDGRPDAGPLGGSPTARRSPARFCCRAT